MTTMTQLEPIYKRGDVVLVLFPDSNLLTAKSRPGLLVQADNLQTGLPQVIVAILLSTPEGQLSGLLMDSVVMADNLATVFESAIDRVIGSLPMVKVDVALRNTLDL